jgi:hypothetical protein
MPVGRCTPPRRHRPKRLPSERGPSKRRRANRGLRLVNPPRSKPGRDTATVSMGVATLRDIRRRLTRVQSEALKAAIGLEAQSADFDIDIARILRRLVSDELIRLIWRLNHVLRHDDCTAGVKGRQP